MSNMSLNLMHMGGREEECNKLLDNILKLDAKNENLVSKNWIRILNRKLEF